MPNKASRAPFLNLTNENEASSNSIVPTLERIEVCIYTSLEPHPEEKSIPSSKSTTTTRVLSGEIIIPQCPLTFLVGGESRRYCMHGDDKVLLESGLHQEFNRVDDENCQQDLKDDQGDDSTNTDFLKYDPFRV
jgi:hypothetical protein